MDHTYIDEHLVLDRYLQGELQPEDAVRFEQHFLDCKRCLDRLELYEKLQQGVKTSARSGASPVGTAGRVIFWKPLWSWLLPLAILTIATLFGSQLLKLRQDLAVQPQGSARWAAGQPMDPQAPAPYFLNWLATEIATLRSQLVVQKQLFTAQIEREERAKDDLARELAQTLRPNPQTPWIASTGLARPGSHLSATPWRLTADAGWFVFVLTPAPPRLPQYQVRLLRAAATVVWEGQLRLDAEGRLVLAIHTSWLGAGAYTLYAAGLLGGGGSGRDTSYSARIEVATPQ